MLLNYREHRHVATVGLNKNIMLAHKKHRNHMLTHTSWWLGDGSKVSYSMMCIILWVMRVEQLDLDIVGSRIVVTSRYSIVTTIMPSEEHFWVVVDIHCCGRDI